ncbi:hypothetical protein FRC12_010792 [Ceratobasidium sp. 428]|nr:hypothetical protein FRC09_004214 [Ceratobasidium sp. 395]KAG8755717.1 hypothetical protein FRC12_010792 [Ceratobasidium sp. 428]
MPLPGERVVRFLIRALRLATVGYVFGLTIANIIIAGIDGWIGEIIASVYLLPVSFVLLILEFGFLARFVRSRVSLLRQEMHPVRMIALQAVSAMLCTGPLFIPACVAFGLSVGLMNLVGVYHLFWKGRGGEESGSDVWSQSDVEKAPRSSGLLMPAPSFGEEDALLISVGSVDDLTNQSGSEQGSARSGPTVLSVD